MKKRILSFVLSAAMLLMPVVSLAEEGVSSYSAGDLTVTAVSESYTAGNQINLNAVLGLDVEEGVTDERILALDKVLSGVQLHMSFYDDFGTARIHAQLNTGDTTLLSADALIYEDGSAQIMSSLTGKLVLAVPAGGMDAAQPAYTMADFDMTTDEGIEAFNALPAAERLRITSDDMISLLINHLLGWVSFTQMETGELYTFDDTYLEATEKRDAVAQRMLGKLDGYDFNRLLWNVTSTIADTTGDFQHAVADILAARGVTRYQARKVIDAIFTEETVDPALDYVSTSYFIIENKDESPIEYDDVSYFFKKLQKCTDRLWCESTDNVLTMDVSYDDFGGMVGFDAHLPVFTNVLPYEGDFTYSIKTDDDWQRLHSAHGELQVYNDNRVIGDLDIQFGEDVGGVNHSHFVGMADVVNQKDKTSYGFGVESNLDFEVAVGEAGEESENFEGAVVLNLRKDGENNAAASVTVSGQTVVDAESFGLSATAALGMQQAGMLVADVTLEQGEYEDIVFAGGQAIDVTALDDAQKDTIKKEVAVQAAKLSLSLMSKPDVLSGLITLFGSAMVK